MSEEIKACRFCGSSKIDVCNLVLETHIGIEIGEDIAECGDCGARAPIRFWNTRAEESSRMEWMERVAERFVAKIRSEKIFVAKDEGPYSCLYLGKESVKSLILEAAKEEK